MERENAEKNDEVILLLFCMSWWDTQLERHSFNSRCKRKTLQHLYETTAGHFILRRCSAMAAHLQINFKLSMYRINREIRKSLHLRLPLIPIGKEKKKKKVFSGSSKSMTRFLLEMKASSFPICYQHLHFDEITFSFLIFQPNL